MKITAIIPAAGSGTRYSSNKNKLFENLTGMPVIIHTLKKISAVKEINNIIICTSADLIGEMQELIKDHNILKVEKIIPGGKTRQESVYIGLAEAENFLPDYVLIHDAARPLITDEIIRESIKTAVEKGASVVAVPVKDTIKKVNSETKEVIETLKRDELWSIQTPQVFKFKEILEAHEKFKGQNFTDDAALLEEMRSGSGSRSGCDEQAMQAELVPSINIVEGSYKNIKITTAEDLKIARDLIED